MKEKYFDRTIILYIDNVILLNNITHIYFIFYFFIACVVIVCKKIICIFWKYWRRDRRKCSLFER